MNANQLIANAMMSYSGKATVPDMSTQTKQTPSPQHRVFAVDSAFPVMKQVLSMSRLGLSELFQQP